MKIFDSLFIDRLLDERRLQRIAVCIVEDEQPQWSNHPLLRKGLQLITLPSGSRLEETKQWILDKEQGKYHVVTDDDLVLMRRVVRGSPKLCSYNDILDLFDQIADMVSVKHVAHGGVSSSQVFCEKLMNTPNVVLSNTRVGGLHWYDRDLLRAHKINYLQAPLAEDLHSQLTLLKASIPNAQLWEFCYNQVTGSKGGCSIYRTLESSRAAAINLHKLHPDCVKLKEKYSKLWGGNVLSIFAYYKKAFKGSAQTGSHDDEKHSEDDDHDITGPSSDDVFSPWHVYENEPQKQSHRRTRRASVRGRDLG